MSKTHWIDTSLPPLPIGFLKPETLFSISNANKVSSRTGPWRFIENNEPGLIRVLSSASERKTLRAVKEKPHGSINGCIERPVDGSDSTSELSG